MTTTTTRIVHLSTVHRSSDVRIRVKECRSLAAAGFDVTLIANRAEAEPIADGIDVVELPPPPLGRLGRAVVQPFRALGHIRRIDPEVVHFHDPELLLTAAVLRLLGYPSIYDVHEDLPKQTHDKTYLPRWLRLLAARALQGLEPRLARVCDAVVVVDRSWADRFARSESIALANYPLRTEFGGPGPPPDLGSVAPHFVYAGGLSRIRGTEWLIRAAQRMPDEFTVSIAGRTSAPYAAQLDALDARGRVDRLGWIDRPSIVSLYRSALAGLVPLAPTPNYSDAVATKIFEYAHAGIPMILSDLPGHRAFNAEHDLGLLVDFDDDEALIDAMTTLHEDRELAARLGANGVELAQSYCWEHEVQSLLDFYKRYDRHRDG